MAGWTLRGEVQQFSPDQLWRFIDGAAEQYLAHGVRGLRVGELARDDLSVSVSLFDMETPLNACGIYYTEKAAGPADLALGSGAALALPYQAMMFKGPFFVKVESWQGKLTETAAKELLAELATVLPGPAGLPAEFAVLPGEGRVAGSERYTPESYLGLADLDHCLHADYRGPQGETYQLFYLLADSSRTLPAIWQELASKWKGRDGPHGPFLVREIPYRGPVMITAAQQGILGVVGLKTEKELLAALLRAVNKQE